MRAQNIREASKKELELAIKTQELVTEDADEKLKRNLIRLSEKYPEEMLEPMVHKLNEKKRSQFLHFRNQFKKKFQFLKEKQHQGDDEGVAEHHRTHQMEVNMTTSPAVPLPLGQLASTTSHAGLEQNPSTFPAQGQLSTGTTAVEVEETDPAHRRSSQTRARRFVKRGRYRRIQRKKVRGKVKLTTNYSDYTLSLSQERVLNRGLNFCPQPAAVNRTKVEAGLKRMARIICWADYFHGMDQDREEVEDASLIKEKKSNFPPTTGQNKYVPSRGVKEFITSTHDAIVSAPLKPYHSNLPVDQVAALKELKKQQDQRKIVIKPNDKMGGQSVMNTEDYVKKVEEMLSATFVDENNEEQRYYKGPIAGMYVDQHFNHIKKYLEESAKSGIITESDAKNLLPKEPTPGRFYGLVKNQKGIPDGEKIPPLRPVVSGVEATQR